MREELISARALRTFVKSESVRIVIDRLSDGSRQGRNNPVGLPHSASFNEAKVLWVHLASGR